MAFDAAKALADPGFTPGAQHLPVLFELLERSDEDGSERLVRVIARAGRVALDQAGARWAESRPACARVCCA
jgi:hypothetical protein